MLGMSLGLRPMFGAPGGVIGAPMNLSPPTVSGTTAQGQSLTASSGVWDGVSPISYTYQWHRDGALIGGATTAAYTVQLADVGAAVSVLVTAANAAGAGTATSAAVVIGVGQALTDLPIAPTARWHPAFSAVTQNAGRVVSASDLQGLAGVVEGALGIGPRALTDADGRKFWRFEGDEFLTVSTALAGLQSRGISIFMVGRPHRAMTSNPIFSIGSAAAGTAVSSQVALETSAIGGAPFLRSFNRSASLSPANARHLICGSQLQVMGVCARGTAAGGVRMMVNGKSASGITQPGVGFTGVNGGEIGRNSGSIGAAKGLFDLYELVVYNAGLTDVQAASVQTALQASYGIVEIENQLVMIGDSITQQIGSSGQGMAMQITDPLANLIPANWRVVNIGIAGYMTTDIESVKNTANSWATQILPGQNVASMMIGTNDAGVYGNRTAAQIYANVVAFYNAPATGALQRGWTVRQRINIACGGEVQFAVQSALTTLFRAPAFSTDTQTASGQTYAGKLSLTPTDLITVGGDSKFLTQDDSRDLEYYLDDSTHPTALGATAMVTGGDTPAYGVAYGL